MEVGEKKKVCECSACASGHIYMIKRGEFKYDFKCDNPTCQTNMRRMLKRFEQDAPQNLQ